MKLDIRIFALAALGQGLSGSDRIFIEFAKRWKRSNEVSVYLWNEGYLMCKRQKLEGVNFRVSNMEPWKRLGFVVNYLARIMEGIMIGLTIDLENKPTTIVYSASEFWMDSFPALLLKLRFKKIKWVAGWFQTAPNPYSGFASGSRQHKYRLSSLIYWLVQLPIKPLISKFADFILINNEEEKKYFPGINKKLIIVFGAVNLSEINTWIKRNKKKYSVPKYDAVFQGRFHPQKGVVELVEIWGRVCSKLPNAKLVMIGDGPLMRNVKEKIRLLGLKTNILLPGYIFDGSEKFSIFAKSKIVLHPAFFDSGGMAAAEAMAFGIPCVGFNLPAYDSYYPMGMLKVDVGDLEKFSQAILLLLKNSRKRVRIGKEASNLIKSHWSWDERAKEILAKL